MPGSVKREDQALSPILKEGSTQALSGSLIADGSHLLPLQSLINLQDSMEP